MLVEIMQRKYVKISIVVEEDIVDNYVDGYMCKGGNYQKVQSGFGDVFVSFYEKILFEIILIYVYGFFVCFFLRS